MKTAQLLDHRGQPVRKAALQTEVAAATIGGVRSPISGYPADGLNPVRLANILRQADAGDPVRYLELLELIEERDPHYVGLLRNRRQAVAQLEFKVEAGSDAPEDKDRAKMIEDWLRRDELTQEVFDILDCIGKGYSFTEILWETSGGVWMPRKLARRDPRWFRFDRIDLETPLLLGETGEELPLPAFQFIFAAMPSKSGIPTRSGVGRLATWNWFFKGATQRDCQIFIQTYGQPLRVGKFGPGASEKDKDTLFAAVSNIAGDCAAIIPESMTIDFIETSNVGSSSDLYEKRLDWLDRQMSKAIVGQTATTDAEVGGLGSGREHRQVQEDIERADARMLSAILNRDLIQPWMQLNFGPLKVYPRLKIERPEPEDVEALAKAAELGVRMGLKISARKTRERLGLDEPEGDDDILQPLKPAEPPPTDPAAAPDTGPLPSVSQIKSQSGVFKRGEAPAGTETALNAEGGSTARKSAPSEFDPLLDRLAAEAAPAVDAMLARIEAMMEAAGSLEELREMLLEAYPDLDVTDLAGVLARAMMAGHAGGRVAALDDSERGGV